MHSVARIAWRNITSISYLCMAPVHCCACRRSSPVREHRGVMDGVVAAVTSAEGVVRGGACAGD